MGEMGGCEMGRVGMRVDMWWRVVQLVGGRARVGVMGRERSAGGSGKEVKGT